MNYRNLYSKRFISTGIMFTMFILSNEQLRLQCDDPAVSRRITYCPFEAKFVYDPQHSKEYKRDDDLYRKLPDLRLELFHLLLRRLNATENVKIPEAFKKYTMERLENTDTLKDMLNMSFCGVTAEDGQPDQRFNLSFPAIKTILKNQHGYKYTKAVEGYSQSELLEKIDARLPYTGGVMGSIGAKSPKQYPHQWRCGFIGIKTAPDDEYEDEECDL